MEFHSSPFNSNNSLFVLLLIFSTFNHNSFPFMYSSFFLKVWINLSIIYSRTFALTWALPSPVCILLYIDAPAHLSKCKRNNWMPPFLFLCNILRKKWVMKLIFCMQINIKVSYQLILKGHTISIEGHGQAFSKYLK